MVKAKSYKQMSKSQRKVEIAKDVIANIHAKQLHIGMGSYVYADKIDVEDLEVLKKYLPSQQVAQIMKPNCTVCARGSMMICKIAKFNDYDLKNINLDEVDGSHTTEALKDAFTEEELFCIECCFELWDEYNQCYHPCGSIIPDDVIDTWAKIKDPTDRLLAIMQNIIDHKGVFKPEVAYEVYYK